MKYLIKILSSCHKLLFVILVSVQPDVLDLCNFKLNAVRSNNKSLNNQRVYIVRLQFQFAAKTSYLSENFFEPWNVDISHSMRGLRGIGKLSHYTALVSVN